jgi:hypothetical protein
MGAHFRQPDAKEKAATANDEAENLRKLSVFLRVYGALSFVIFGSLFLGFAVETPLLADEPRGAYLPVASIFLRGHPAAVDTHRLKKSSEAG